MTPSAREILMTREDDHVFMLSDAPYRLGWLVGRSAVSRDIVTLPGVHDRRRISPLGDLSIQYADYAVWQRDWLKGDVLEGQLGYWKRQLENLPITQLPTDRPRPPCSAPSGCTERESISMRR